MQAYTGKLSILSANDSLGKWKSIIVVVLHYNKIYLNPWVMV